jgi:uncharacterized protein
MYFKACQNKTGDCIACRVEIAQTFIKKFIGLMGRSKINKEQGIYFLDCRSIHSFFMRFSIDVLFLDKEMKITRIVNCLKPNRVVIAPLQTKDTLELQSGVLDKFDLKVGDAIRLIEINNESSIS